MGHIAPEAQCEDAAFIDATAHLFGAVTLGRGVSVFPQVVMRAEVHEIRIGARSNVLDFVMIHIGFSAPTVVGEDCSITHRATLHSCEIGDRRLIGVGAAVMDGAKIGANSIVAGHALVREIAVFPENSMISGAPARQIAERDNSEANLANARFHQMIAKNYAEGRERLNEAELAALAQAVGA
ncbi:MAG: gamma carbonic anhydrase family protein [Pseudomonadota bacterium]